MPFSDRTSAASGRGGAAVDAQTWLAQPWCAPRKKSVPPSAAVRRRVPPCRFAHVPCGGAHCFSCAYCTRNWHV
eukprot:4949735-Prymnesium_polylepis.2